MTTFYVDEIAGNDANSGLTFPLRKKTLASVAAAGAVPGDTIRVMGKPSTLAGINATFTNLSGTVTLASALTKGIYTTGAAWTPSANVTVLASQAGKLAATSASNIAIAAGFTTGKAAFFATGALNLSTYQQLSFWIKANAAVAAGALRLDLCSDATGDTPVDQFTLPALTANVWQAITIDKGANLGAAIASIRLFAVSDPGTVTITLDDIIGCKAASAINSLSLNSLLSSGNGIWYAIKSINSVGTSVRLDTGGPASAQSAVGIWSGTTGSQPLSILNPLTGSALGVAGAPITDTFNVSGVAGNVITISGGWDSTDMSTQNGLSVFDAQLSGSTGLNLSADFITIDHFVFTRYTTSLGLNGATKRGYTLSNTMFANAGGLFTLPQRAVIFDAVTVTNSIGGLTLPLSANYQADGLAYNLAFVKIIGNTSGDGISVPANIGSPAPVIHDCSVIANKASGANGFKILSPCIFYNNTANDNTVGTTSVGFLFQSANALQAYNLQARNNSGAQVQINNASVEINGLDTNFNRGTQVKFVNGSGGQLVVTNWIPNATATKYNLGDPAVGETSNNLIASHKEGGNLLNNNIYTDFGTITTNGVVGQSGTGVGWQLFPNANAFASSPLRLNVGTVPCPAAVPTTVKFWAKCSAASGIGAQFKVFGGRYPGVGAPGSDIVTVVSGTAWTEYSLTFTPSENCVIEVFIEAFGSSSENVTMSGPVTITQ